MLCSLIAVPGPLAAETVPALCGTHRDGLLEELALSRTASAAAWRAKQTTLARLAAADRDYGEIAVIGAGGGVISRRNPFNLQGRTIGFLPAGEGRYRFVVASGGFDEGAAEAGTPIDGLGDDDFRLLDLPFPFPYFGKTYRQVFVHSDGNLTFEAPDAASSSRSLGRMTAGPPRIAPQFADLDPSRAPGSVRYAALEDAFIVTWLQVPEYSSFGLGARQTVQAVLYPDGAIQLTLRQADIGNVVTGIAPGRLSGPTTVVSFLAGSDEAYRGAVVERFGSSESVDTTLAAQRFYQTHEDSYDYLVFFNALDVMAGPSALASELTVRSATRGIGDTPVQSGPQYGSGYRLQAVLNMGPLGQYPLDPYAPVGLRGLITGDNTMTILGHETGHLFLALASIRDPVFPNDRPLLGAGLAHWSFNFNSEASLLEGNRIQDNGPTQQNRFVTIATVEGYSPLDQYLMGLREPHEVPSTFVVYPASASPSSLPRVGTIIRGTRLDVTVDDIIEAEGPRVPDSGLAQRRFRFAFILIVPEGQEPSPVWLDQLERYRKEFIPYFERVTGQRATADISLKKMLRISAWPHTGVVAGEEARISLETAAPAPRDLQIQLTPSGGLTPPRSVTIAAGTQRAEFLVRGGEEPTGALLARPQSDEYETAEARFSVARNRADLAVSLYYHGWSTVLRVTDSREAPYSNIPIRLVGSTGLAEPLYGWKTDESGYLYLNFTPGGAGRQTITVEIEDTPSTRVTIEIPQL